MSSKNYYRRARLITKNSIRVGKNRVEQVRERISGDELEGDLCEERLPSCIQSQLEYLHR